MAFSIPASRAAQSVWPRWSVRVLWGWLGILLVSHILGGLVTSSQLRTDLDRRSAGERTVSEIQQNLPALNEAHAAVGIVVAVFAILMVLSITGSEQRPMVRRLAWAAGFAVLFEGAIAWALPATGISPSVSWFMELLAVLHGALSHLLIGAAAILLVALTPALSDPPRDQHALNTRRVVRRFSSVLVSALVVQLVLGALFRHERLGRALVLHVIVGAVILISSAVTGFLLSARRADGGSINRPVHILGVALLLAAPIQVVLGVIAVSIGQGPTMIQAALRTGHQTGGAIVVALAAASWAYLHDFARFQMLKRSPAAQ